MYYLRVNLVTSVLALLCSTAFSIPQSNVNLKRQGSRPDDPTLNSQRADAVKEAFTFAWDGYYKYAFPNDELNPVTNTFSNSRYVKVLLIPCCQAHVL
jgi:mannosyl-oligosaccharide alpha-1,2-mannosidase